MAHLDGPDGRIRLQFNDIVRQDAVPRPVKLRKVDDVGPFPDAVLSGKLKLRIHRRKRILSIDVQVLRMVKDNPHAIGRNDFSRKRYWRAVLYVTKAIIPLQRMKRKPLGNQPLLVRVDVVDVADVVKVLGVVSDYITYRHYNADNVDVLSQVKIFLNAQHDDTLRMRFEGLKKIYGRATDTGA